MATAPSRSHQPLLRVTGVLMAAIVVAGYAVALRSGHWPPSHPWSGLTLLGLAAIQYRAGSPTEYRFRALQLGGAVVAGCGAVLWLMSALSAAR